MASRQSGLRFSVYLGDLGDAPNERVAELHDQLEGSSEAVLVARQPRPAGGGGAHRARRPAYGCPTAAPSWP